MEVVLGRATAVLLAPFLQPSFKTCFVLSRKVLACYECELSWLYQEAFVKGDPVIFIRRRWHFSGITSELHMNFLVLLYLTLNTAWVREIRKPVLVRGMRGKTCKNGHSFSY